MLDDFASQATEEGLSSGRRCCPFPRLLTVGASSTESPTSPSLFPNEVPEFSHGGYDGGIMVSFDSTWNPLKFSPLLDQLEQSKNLAGEVEKVPKVSILELAGEEVLVMPVSGKAGGDDAKGGIEFGLLWYKV